CWRGRGARGGAVWRWFGAPAGRRSGPAPPKPPPEATERAGARRKRKKRMGGGEPPPRAPAAGAEVRKDGEKWTLILVRELRHPPAKVWQALTEPAQLREWAPFDADRNLGDVGPVKLATVGAQPPQVSETSVKR